MKLIFASTLLFSTGTLADSRNLRKKKNKNKNKTAYSNINATILSILPTGMNSSSLLSPSRVIPSSLLLSQIKKLTPSPTTISTTSATLSEPVSTDTPTSNPTDRVTTSLPTSNPTNIVTTSLPTSNPTDIVTTSLPTSNPTVIVTTSLPTSNPTDIVTTSLPTSNPTDIVTTSLPTSNPTDEPTSTPTVNPTSAPTTSAPTSKPTNIPTTAAPTLYPTKVLSNIPSVMNSTTPSENLSTLPSLVSSMEPSLKASNSPTVMSSEKPSVKSSRKPSAVSSESPTVLSSEMPTVVYSNSPSVMSSEAPTIVSSETPTIASSIEPTIESSNEPSLTPVEVEPVDLFANETKKEVLSANSTFNLTFFNTTDQTFFNETKKTYSLPISMIELHSVIEKGTELFNASESIDDDKNTTVYNLPSESMSIEVYNVSELIEANTTAFNLPSEPKSVEVYNVSKIIEVNTTVFNLPPQPKSILVYNMSELIEANATVFNTSVLSVSDKEDEAAETSSLRSKTYSAGLFNETIINTTNASSYDNLKFFTAPLETVNDTSITTSLPIETIMPSLDNINSTAKNVTSYNNADTMTQGSVAIEKDTVAATISSPSDSSEQNQPPSNDLAIKRNTAIIAAVCSFLVVIALFAGFVFVRKRRGNQGTTATSVVRNTNIKSVKALDSDLAGEEKDPNVIDADESIDVLAIDSAADSNVLETSTSPPKELDNDSISAVSTFELIDIFVPPGRLGVVISTINNTPVVHQIKSSSVLYGKLQVGDALVAVDDADVRTYSASKISKLISTRRDNATRKLTILRTCNPEDK